LGMIVAAILVFLTSATLVCAAAVVMFCTLHLRKIDEREVLWQRLSARQAKHDFQQREYEETRGPAPIEPDLTPAEKVELSALNQWAMARRALVSSRAVVRHSDEQSEIHGAEANTLVN
jgi:hypothetical protein